MRKKFFIIAVVVILTLATSLFAYGAIVEENLNVIDAEYTDEEGWHSSLLYSDNRMLMWNSSGNEEIIENVKKRIHSQDTPNKPVYLTYDNKLNYGTKDGNKVIENVLDFEIGKIENKESIVYINDKKELHTIPYGINDIYLSLYETKGLVELLESYGELDSLNNYEENDNQAIIYFFYADFCSYCTDFISSLRELDAEILNKIKLVAFDISYNYNDELLYRVKEHMGTEADGSIPYMVIGETDILGFSESYINTIITSVETLYDMELSERPDLIKSMNEGIEETSTLIDNNVEKIVFNKRDYYSEEVLVYLNSNNILQSYDGFYGEIEDVIDIGENYFLTENNELYYMSANMYTRIATNVTKVVDVKKYENINIVFEVLDSNNSQYFVYYDVINDDYFHGYYGPTMKDLIIYDEIMGDGYYLTEEGKLLVDYSDDSEGFIEITTNVKEIHRNTDNEAIMILYNTGELYYKCFGIYCYADEFIDELTGQTTYYKDVDYKVLENVETLKYYDKNYILMSDKSVYRYGYNDMNQFKGNDDFYFSDVPIQIDELINNGDEIVPKYIKLNLENTKGIIGSNIYTNPVIIPANVNSGIALSSSNENVASINKYNVILKEKGTSTICAVAKDDNQIKDCNEINTYLPINAISIEEKEIWLKEYEDYILTINVGPEGYLDESIDIGWEINGENDDAIDIETDEYYDYEKGEYVLLEPNQILITARSGGTYELRLKQKGCKTEECIQTLKVNIEEDIYRIDVVIDEEYFDGNNNAYMFINEKNTLQVNYKQYMATATTKKVLFSSSDPTIASIDENGLITAHKEGKVTITLTADDESRVSESFILTIYNYDTGNVKKGDVNKDGEINILDIIKLRKYLAGLEDLEE